LRAAIHVVFRKSLAARAMTITVESVAENRGKPAAFHYAFHGRSADADAGILVTAGSAHDRIGACMNGLRHGID
jgi:hypothetical protein